MNYKKIYFKTIDSTNDYVLKNIESLKDKTVVYAERQTKGKGRNNRKWLSSEKSNLYFTILIKPIVELDKNLHFSNIQQYMAVILCRVFSAYDISSFIKWPNDILVNYKKISGILCETVFKGESLLGISIGVGVNLNMTEEFLNTIDQPATSLNLLTGIKTNRKEFFDKLLSEFFKGYDDFMNFGFESIMDEYNQKLLFVGDKIKIHDFDSIYSGVFQSVNSKGQLVLLDECGSRINVNIGDLIIDLFNNSESK